MLSIPTVRLYNTETGQEEPLHPSDGKTFRVYTCGPTVYNYAHIGNFRTYLFEDLLCRTLRASGMQVEQVMNLTDIDDKTLRGAIEQGISLSAFTQPYIDAFFEDLRQLHIAPAQQYPRATEYIPQMIQMIEGLLEKGFAYPGADGSIYYAISRFPSYGRLAHLNFSGLRAGASERLNADEYDKESASDFALWKGYDPTRDGTIFWESPWGRGRPGWHIECSAMATALLGETLDLHAGGVDNMFPHHENEIAQSEAYTGKCFAHHWVHGEHLLVDGKKMSKSLGNCYTLRDLEQKGFSGRQVRFALMQAHYRSQLNFTLEGVEAAASSLQRFEDCLYRLEQGRAPLPAAELLAEKMLTHFGAALARDLNLPEALAALFDGVRDTNTLLDRHEGESDGAHLLRHAFHQIDQVLAILPSPGEEASVPAAALQALAERTRAREEKRWADADQWRTKIQEQGYTVEDTPQGPRLKRALPSKGSA